MKKVILLLLMATNYLSAGYNIPQHTLPLNTETDHFKLYCLANDKEAAQKVLTVAETNFKKLSADFKHTYSAKINLYVFPNIQEQHKAIGALTAGDWLVNSYDEKTHSFYTVSPQNPGSHHSAESILQLNIVGLTKLFIKDTYPNKMPDWFCLGIGLWMAGYVDKTALSKLASDHTQIPSFQQLEKLNSTESFDSRTMYQSCAYSIVEYMNSQWGWEKILTLLADFSSFEKVQGITQETFRTQWINYLDTTYQTKK
jgi:hypothetical protein